MRIIREIPDELPVKNGYKVTETKPNKGMETTCPEKRKNPTLIRMI